MNKVVEFLKANPVQYLATDWLSLAPKGFCLVAE